MRMLRGRNSLMKATEILFFVVDEKEHATVQKLTEHATVQKNHRIDAFY